MKNYILIITAALFLVSCSAGPEDAAKNFTENLAKGKIEEAKTYATSSTGKLLDMANTFGGLPIDPDFTFDLLKDSVVDNKAWVSYIDQKGKEEIVNLVKIDGEWLVHLESGK